jgi:hypothetical protein
VDNSVDEIFMDPISLPVSGLKHYCSIFVHMQKKPEKQAFASKRERIHIFGFKEVRRTGRCA